MAEQYPGLEVFKDFINSIDDSELKKNKSPSKKRSHSNKQSFPETEGIMTDARRELFEHMRLLRSFESEVIDRCPECAVDFFAAIDDLQAFVRDIPSGTKINENDLEMICAAMNDVFRPFPSQNYWNELEINEDALLEVEEKIKDLYLSR